MNEPKSEQETKQAQSQVEHRLEGRSASSVQQVGERVQRLIDAAERAADAIREDAERQANEYLAEAQRRADRLTTDRIQLIANLTDDLIVHAGAVRSHSERMVDSLEQTIKTITAGERIELDPDRAPSLGRGVEQSADSDPDRRELESGPTAVPDDEAVEGLAPRQSPPDEESRTAEANRGRTRSRSRLRPGPVA